jgi:hypothetical protein
MASGMPGAFAVSRRSGILFFRMTSPLVFAAMSEVIRAVIVRILSTGMPAARTNAWVQARRGSLSNDFRGSALDRSRKTLWPGGFNSKARLWTAPPDGLGMTALSKTPFSAAEPFAQPWKREVQEGAQFEWNLTLIRIDETHGDGSGFVLFQQGHDTV